MHHNVIRVSLSKYEGTNKSLSTLPVFLLSVSVEDVLLAVGDQVGHADLSYASWRFWRVVIGV